MSDNEIPLPNIEEMRYAQGELSLVMERHPAVDRMAEAFIRFYKEVGGINYVSMSFTDKVTDEGYSFIIRPDSGLSPEAVNDGLIATLSALIAECDTISSSGDLTECVDRLSKLVAKAKVDYPILVKK